MSQEQSDLSEVQPRAFFTKAAATEALRRLGVPCSVSTISTWIASGRLAARRPGRSVLIARADLASLVGVDPSALGA